MALPRDPDGAPLYSGTCRGREMPVNEGGVAWRLDMEMALKTISEPLCYWREDETGSGQSVSVNPLQWGDVVLARKDIATSYHLSVVVDDALQGITHVVRGTDLEAATSIHVVLQFLLGLQTPVYRFHPLIEDERGVKLAKSRGSESLHDLRERGITSSDIRRNLGFWPCSAPAKNA